MGMRKINYFNIFCFFPPQIKPTRHNLIAKKLFKIFPTSSIIRVTHSIIKSLFQFLMSRLSSLYQHNMKTQQNSHKHKSHKTIHSQKNPYPSIRKVVLMFLLLKVIQMCSQRKRPKKGVNNMKIQRD